MLPQAMVFTIHFRKQKVENKKQEQFNQMSINPVSSNAS